MRFVFKLLCKHHICLLFLQKGFCMKCSIIFNVLPKSFKEVDTVILNTVCPIWIWLTLFAYYGAANYISAIYSEKIDHLFSKFPLKT